METLKLASEENDEGRPSPSPTRSVRVELTEGELVDIIFALEYVAEETWITRPRYNAIRDRLNLIHVHLIAPECHHE